MNQCNDKSCRNLLHAFELGILSDADRMKVEVHILECESCFKAAKKLREANMLIKSHPQVIKLIDDIVKEYINPQIITNYFFQYTRA